MRGTAFISMGADPILAIKVMSTNAALGYFRLNNRGAIALGYLVIDFVIADSLRNLQKPEQVYKRAG